MEVIASRRRLEVVGQDDAGKNWIQAGSFYSLLEAKSFIRREIALDLGSMRAQNGTLCLNLEGFLRCLSYGLLPDDVRDYLNCGVTHLGFGPAIKTLDEEIVNYPNRLGVWRPYQKLYL